MKKWYYSLPTPSLWSSFDYGEVEAETYEEALEEAKIKLKLDFEIANEALESVGHTLEYDESQIEVEQIK